MNRQKGFTLIEMVLVMIVITAGFAGLSSLFANTARALNSNENLQKVAQYAQECSETIIARRRTLGYTASVLATSATSTVCGATAPSGASRVVSIGSEYTGTSGTACPQSIACKDVSVAVASTSNGSLTSIITLMLVNY